MAATALVLAAVLLGAGCTDAPAVKRVFAMDTYMSLKVYDGNGLSEAGAYIERLDGLLSATDEESEISALMNSKGAPVKVSEETFDLLSRALELSETLGDSFELTLRPVSKAWGFTTGKYRIPADEELSGLLELVDDGRVELDETEKTVTLPEGMMLDLGAVAKGYAADGAAKILKEHGTKAGLLDLGSSTILAFGSKPDGSKWKIALRNSTSAESFVGTIELDEGAVSTSGGYERCFYGEDGETYWHIIDPETGRPARTGVSSVTVVTESALYGDALSTALFVMGPDEAELLWRERGDFEYLMILEDGRLLISAGLDGIFAPHGSFEQAEKDVIR